MYITGSVSIQLLIIPNWLLFITNVGGTWESIRHPTPPLVEKLVRGYEGAVFALFLKKRRPDKFVCILEQTYSLRPAAATLHEFLDPPQNS